jgi:outer membrane receptor protein involved in Fe transport
LTLVRTAAAAVLACQALTAPAQERVGELSTIEVVGTTPLPGIGLPKDQVPANVQTATGADIDRLHALDVAGFLSRSFTGVTVNAMQGNPFQLDVNYRGFTASPLLGTPQGLSVYLDGVRLNQPFGDVVSWDLLPRTAISSIVLMPGSNPLFGLNTLGGALSIQTKDGLSNPGTSVEVLGGSYGRAAAEFETGGSNDKGFNWYIAGNRFHEQGWRHASPSDLSQFFTKLGMKSRDGEVSLTAALSDNRLTGNGLQEQGALQRDWRSVYTMPDTTQNRSTFLNLAASRVLANDILFTGNAYYRDIRASTLNGDVNEDSLTQSVYGPGENPANTPFPSSRCIANVQSNDEPNEKCTGLLNRTETRQHNYGLAGQLSAQTQLGGFDHQWTVGAAYDASRVDFAQSAQFGFVAPNRSIVPVFGPGAFADGTQNSENAFDARVDLHSRSRTWSVYATDTVALDARTHLTFSGRFNNTVIDNMDGITPGGGPGSLDGSFTFSRFNPAIGLTFAPTQSLTFYAGANQGSRAPTAVELGCADPSRPCKLPNSFAGDPPLKQVVVTTFEAGVRGTAANALHWNFGVFHSDNRDDILFVTDNASGFGFFKNFGKTRRQGVEMGIDAQPVREWTLGANLSLLDATYQSAETIRGSGNSSNSAALAGAPGTEGTILIQPGDRIPLLPSQTLKLFAQWEPSAKWRMNLDMTASSGANVRGNENGLHTPDSLYYTGPGRSAGYAVLNLGVDYRPKPGLKFFLQIDNLLDRKYTTAAQLGANAFTVNGAFVARAFPINANGDYPVPRATFFAPGAPRTAWVGLRYSFGA